MLEIHHGQVFVNGTACSNPEQIGLAILDIAEQAASNPKWDKHQTIHNYFTHGDIVYLRHDIEQFPRMVTQIIIERDAVLYELACGSEMSVHRGFEMSKTKTIH